MNIFFDIPDALQVPILVDWLHLSCCAKLIAATCNKKRHAELRKVLCSDSCLFDPQLSWVKREWFISYGIKFNQLELESVQLECPAARQTVLDCASPKLERVKLDLTHKDKKWNDEKPPTPIKSLSINLAAVFNELALRFPHMKHLHFERNSRRENMVPSDGFQSLCDYIASSTTLKSVRFENMVDISERLLEALCEAPSLQCVVFESCKFTPSALNYSFTKTSRSVLELTITQHVAVCAFFPKITELHISNITESDVSILAQKCPLVETLDMHVYRKISKKETIHTMSGHWQHLRVLNVISGLADEGLLRMLITECRSLTSIVTVAEESCHEFYNTFLKSVPSCVYPPKCTGPRLRELRTTCSSAETLRHIVIMCWYLHTLHIEPCKKQKSVPFPVHNCLNYLLRTELQSLSISRYPMEDEDLLRLQHSKIHTLCISFCPNITRASVVKLVPTLPHLHTLQLFYCDGISNDVVLDVPPLCPTLRTFAYTKHTDCYCYGGSSSDELFAKVLPRLYPHVTRFDVNC